jgi:ubiquinone biosynthesis protein
MAKTRRKTHIVRTFAGYGFQMLFAGLDREGYLAEDDVGEASPGTSRGLRLRLALASLGPTFVKLGQTLSLRGDMIPPDVVDELTHLQDDAPHLAWGDAAKVLRTELGREPHEVFAEFDEEPLASASIGQTYTACLQDGTPVVVKVQRPGIEDQIRLDLSILRDFAYIAQRHTSYGQIADLPGAVEEFTTALTGELDYRREARNTDRFAALFAQTPELRAPAVRWDLSSERVLVLERFEGVKPTDLDAVDALGADRTQLARSLASLGLMGVLGQGWFHADPHPGNLFVLPDGSLGVIDFGRVGYLPEPLRLAIARLLWAWTRQDASGVVDALERFAVRTRRFDRRVLENDIARLFGKYGDLQLGGLSAGDMLADVVKVSSMHGLRMPSDLVLFGNALAMEESLAQRLDPELELMKLLDEEVSGFEKTQLSRDTILQLMQGDAVAWGELVHELPRRSLRTLRHIDEGTLSVEIRMPDVKDATERLEHGLNVLVLGIIVAAIIIGLALSAPHVEDQPRWLQIVLWVSFGAVIVAVLFFARRLKRHQPD